MALAFMSHSMATKNADHMSAARYVNAMRAEPSVPLRLES